MTDDLLAELDDDAPVRERPRRRKRRAGRIWLGVLGGLLALVLVVLAGIWFVLQGKLQQIERIENPFPDEAGRPEQAVVDGEPAINFLLVGTDSRDEAAGDSLLEALGDRSDTIMVVHIPGDRSGVQVMSIMRDSWVDIPGHGTNKINAALSYGGMPLLVQTVEQLLDTRIDHVGVLGFDGFMGITEALGGVTVHNPTAFSSGDYDYPVGEIHLQGEEALVYVRSRYPFSDGDYTRVANQQRFLSAVLGGTLNRGTLTDPGKLLALTDAVTNHLATDEGVDQGFILGLAPELAGLRSSDVTTFTMPTFGTGMEGDQSVVYVDTDRLPALRQAFDDDTLAEFAAGA
ncbi:MAG: LCP family protein [Microbacteriaceae bacterium]|nr:LCP family protein [Microbacteriaceae bacterium]